VAHVLIVIILTYQIFQVTANPKAPEVINNPEYAGADDALKADLICRVFHAKLIELKRLIYKERIFGNPINYISVTEFQKRGIPHAHIILKTDAPVNINLLKCTQFHNLLKFPDGIS
jgi:hypothetical protein